MLGPLGRAFELDPRTRHVLLVAGGLGMAGVRALADEALEPDRQVTLLFGARARRRSTPRPCCRREVEYVVATDDGSLGQDGRVTDLLPDYEAWADQAFACGPRPMLAALARLAAGRDARLGRSPPGPRRGAAPRLPPAARPRRAGGPGSRWRSSRTWAAPWGRAWAASCSASTVRSGSAARGRSSPPTRSLWDDPAT